MSEGRQGAEFIIVGGGLAGLACAQSLSADGYTVQLLEASPSVGGRAMGGHYQGEPFDCGFYAIAAAFPDTSDFLEEIGIGGGDLRTFRRSAVLHDGSTWRRLRVPGAMGIAGSSLMSRRDALRLGALTARLTLAGGVGPEDDGTGPSTEEWLRETKLSSSVIDRVLRPFLGSFLLDRTLSADAAFTRFVLGALTRGGAMVPLDGIRMLAERAAETITRSGGMIWTGVAVDSIQRDAATGRATGVHLADGRTIAAQSVVIAVEADTARRLLEPIDRVAAAALPTDFLGAVSATFALTAPLYDDATVLIDASRAEGDNRVDLVCQITNVTRPDSPGPYIVTAQSATQGWTRVDPDAYARAVGDHIRSTIPGFAWDRAATLIDARAYPRAQYRIPPGRRASLPGPRTAVENIVLAGDCTTHPTIEGAISSGYRAAEAVAGLHP